MEIIRTIKPYKLTSREFQQENSREQVGDVTIGGSELVFIGNIGGLRDFQVSKASKNPRLIRLESPYITMEDFSSTNRETAYNSPDDITAHCNVTL